jgi:3-hydroxyisobutyryl-CoA hydrolase
MANVIVLKGSGPKALCAGGDVATLSNWNREGAEGQQRSTDYFGLEYKLDHLIATYEKPLIAFMDGITMGGGVGLSVHAPFRIATERTVYAMPETTIGFFPDVGGSFFLPRMNGAIGTYLALTSENVRGVNAFYVGIATHYLHSTSLPSLEARLAELRFKDYDSQEVRHDLIDSTIEEFATGLPYDEPMHFAGELRDAIDRCFSLNSIPEILAALNAETGATKEWAQKTLEVLHQRSPTSVYVTLRQMRLGKDWSIKEAFQREHLLAEKFMRHPDFVEGVSARLIDKPARKPEWQPATLEDIKPEDKIADSFFKTEGSARLGLLSNVDYKTYPWRYGSPSEEMVKDIVKTGEKTPRGIVNHFVDLRKGKQGVKEVVQEILNRKVKTNEEGKAVWFE